MIRNIRNRNTKRFFEGHRVAAFQGFADQAARRLTLLDDAGLLGLLRLCRSIGWKRCGATAPGSTASGSTCSGGSASVGRRTARVMWRFWITTEELAE